MRQYQGTATWVPVRLLLPMVGKRKPDFGSSPTGNEIHGV